MLQEARVISAVLNRYSFTGLGISLLNLQGVFITRTLWFVILNANLGQQFISVVTGERIKRLYFFFLTIRKKQGIFFHMGFSLGVGDSGTTGLGMPVVSLIVEYKSYLECS